MSGVSAGFFTRVPTGICGFFKDFP